MSEIRATTISDAAGTGPIVLTKQSAAKVYIYFTQVTATISQSFNVSSVTDTSAGTSTVNYTSGFDAIKYPVPANNSYSADAQGVYSNMNATSSNAVITRDTSNLPQDYAYNLAALGDLA